jgi:DinB family protein
MAGKKADMADTLETAKAIMATTPGRWTSLVETVPEALLVRPAKVGEWSAADCLHHLLTVERELMSVRLRTILDGQPEMVPVDAEELMKSRDGKSPKDLLTDFLELRRQNHAMIAGLTPSDLDRSSFHPEYKADITIRMLLDLWAAHDLQHTVQAEEAMMQAFIPGTGPWRPEFADHDLGNNAER